MLRNLLHNATTDETLEIIRRITDKIIISNPEVPEEVKEEYLLLRALEEDVKQAEKPDS